MGRRKAGSGDLPRPIHPSTSKQMMVESLAQKIVDKGKGTSAAAVISVVQQRFSTKTDEELEQHLIDICKSYGIEITVEG